MACHDKKGFLCFTKARHTTRKKETRRITCGCHETGWTRDDSIRQIFLETVLAIEIIVLFNKNAHSQTMEGENCRQAGSPNDTRACLNGRISPVEVKRVVGYKHQENRADLSRVLRSNIWWKTRLSLPSLISISLCSTTSYFNPISVPNGKEWRVLSRSLLKVTELSDLRWRFPKVFLFSFNNFFFFALSLTNRNSNLFSWFFLSWISTLYRSLRPF